MAKLYKLFVRVTDEGGKRQAVILVDATGNKVGTLAEVEARKAELERIYYARSRWLYEVQDVK